MCTHVADGRHWLLMQGVAQPRTLTRKKDLLTTGVTTDAFTPKGASIMMISCLLYLTVQV
jgi:hypothetical protein